MALSVCGGCGTQYAAGVPHCPHCSSTDRTEEGAMSTRLPTIVVECSMRGCAARGVRRRVMLRSAAPGVLERPQLVCAGCRCWLTDVTEEEDMPKISALGGPSNAAAEEPAAEGEPEPASSGTELKEGEQSSPGNNSSISSSKPSSSPEPIRSSPARTTANRSKKARTGSGTAPSTGGGPTAPTSAADGSE